jgi:hypothetical protein
MRSCRPAGLVVAVVVAVLASVGWSSPTLGSERSDPSGWTVTMSQTPPNPVPRDSPVTISVTVADQDGTGIAGVPVEFTRTSDPQPFLTTTDSEGLAAYVFQTDSDDLDPETVTALVRDPTDDTIRAQVSTAVELEPYPCWDGPPGGLDGWSSPNGARDVLRVQAYSCGGPIVGAEVELFRKWADGWHQVGGRNRVLGDQGEAVFRVRDRNGRTKSVYRAVIGPTPTTEGAISRRLRLR